MNKTKIILPAFILIAIIQLFVPASMIWNREKVLEKGTLYKFKTAPIDPNDPFRGKYITLSFDGNTFEVKNIKNWTRGEEVLVYFTEDSAGFAHISSVEKEALPSKEDYLKTTVRYISSGKSSKITVKYPFNRYYMEESKAYEAELTYRKSQTDTTALTYALVSIKNGQAVLKDVLINGKPIREIVKENKEKR